MTWSARVTSDKGDEIEAWDWSLRDLGTVVSFKAAFEGVEDMFYVRILAQLAR